jgi:hypothetical protein
MKLAALDAAKQFVADRYPGCAVAFLTGSVVRGEDTPYSDLDIIVIADDEPKAYAEAYCAYGWMIEVLMHNRETYRQFVERDCARGRPSLPDMIANGVVLADDGTASDIQREARELMSAGPPSWSGQDIRRARFVTTNHLLDLQGGLQPMEAILAAGELAYALHELILRANGHWAARGKRIPQALAGYDPDLARRFSLEFEIFCRSPHDTESLVRFADEVLAPFGGRLIDGYSSR